MVDKYYAVERHVQFYETMDTPMRDGTLCEGKIYSQERVIEESAVRAIVIFTPDNEDIYDFGMEGCLS